MKTKKLEEAKERQKIKKREKNEKEMMTELETERYTCRVKEKEK